MTCLVTRVTTTALVVAVAAGIWWLVVPRTDFVPTKSDISSYATQSVNSRDLILRSSTLGSGDKALRAVVVRESASTVVVAMSYERFECNGCAQTAQAFIGTVTVHLHDPLGRRAVLDDFTHRAVKYRKLP
ncbi:MAG: hypothetical protein M3Y49_18890 [Actinomycetota bacterium]|nr:hypothetical protein [Actinomycetota bacterium]